MIKFWQSYDNLKIVAKFMKMRNHDHIKGEKGENHIISQGKNLHNSTKSWLFFKKLGSFELLMVWTTRKWSYLLNLTHFRPFYGQITRGVQLLGQRLYICAYKTDPNHTYDMDYGAKITHLWPLSYIRYAY